MDGVVNERRSGLPKSCRSPTPSLRGGGTLACQNGASIASEPFTRILTLPVATRTQPSSIFLPHFCSRVVCSFFNLGKDSTDKNSHHTRFHEKGLTYLRSHYLESSTASTKPCQRRSYEYSIRRGLSILPIGTGPQGPDSNPARWAIQRNR